MNQNTELSIKRAQCGRCDGTRNCDVVGHFADSGEEAEYFYWKKDWFILRCRGCDYVFVQTISSNSEDCIDDYGPNGEPETEYIETENYWPAVSKRAMPDWIDEIPSNQDTGRLHTAILDVYGALNNDLKILAAIGMRTVFDVAAAAVGVSSDLSFSQKLRSLADQSLIREAELPALEVVVDAGSASVHRGWEPTPSELNAMMDVLEAFLLDAFVMPLRKKRIEDGVKTLRVPPRKRKSRSKPHLVNNEGGESFGAVSSALDKADRQAMVVDEN